MGRTIMPRRFSNLIGLCFQRSFTQYPSISSNYRTDLEDVKPQSVILC